MRDGWADSPWQDRDSDRRQLLLKSHRRSSITQAIETFLSPERKRQNHHWFCLTHSVNRNNYFFRLVLNPARPARPAPKRSMVVGSGTGAGPESARPATPTVNPCQYSEVWEKVTESKEPDKAITPWKLTVVPATFNRLNTVRVQPQQHPAHSA